MSDDDQVYEMFAAPLRPHMTNIGDALYQMRVARDIDLGQADQKLQQLFDVAVAASQVLVAADNPPIRRWWKSAPINVNLENCLGRLQATMTILNAS